MEVHVNCVTVLVTNMKVSMMQRSASSLRIRSSCAPRLDKEPVLEKWYSMHEFQGPSAHDEILLVKTLWKWTCAQDITMRSQDA